VISLTDTILIVDDSSFIVEGLVTILKKRYRPLAAYGGKQCLEILKKEKPSIIILDILMEPMDGWETLSRIKENPATKHIPVLMFTAKKISAEEADEHRINIDDFVSKPVTTKKLLEAIEKLLARQETNRRNIALWQSAGIGQDRIDEYTSLMTNLEVDISLLQNMKVQLSLVHDDDNKSQTDFEAVIAAIESRIQEERLHEEELSREMQKSVARVAEKKEHAEPEPALNNDGQENMPVNRETGSSVQPELIDSRDITYGETNPSLSEDLIPKENESPKITVPKIISSPEVYFSDKDMPEINVIPDETSSDFLFEDEDNWEPSQENTEMKHTVESPADEPEHNHILPESSFPVIILEADPATRLLHPNTSTENFDSEGSVSLDQKIPDMEQKTLIHNMTIRSANTLDKKPVIKNTPLSTIGAGTDTSLKIKTPSYGRSKGIVIDNPLLPVEKSPSGGFFSRIISMIIGIFKRH
jgi:CheY-like chemotaxis protein